MYPTIGSQATTRSPSRVSLSRSTPCVDGCWGPMLSTMSAVSSPAPVPTVISRITDGLQSGPGRRPRRLDGSRKHAPTVVQIDPVQQPPVSTQPGRVDQLGRLTGRGERAQVPHRVASSKIKDWSRAVDPERFQRLPLTD